MYATPSVFRRSASGLIVAPPVRLAAANDCVARRCVPIKIDNVATISKPHTTEHHSRVTFFPSPMEEVLSGRARQRHEALPRSYRLSWQPGRSSTVFVARSRRAANHLTVGVRDGTLLHEHHGRALLFVDSRNARE